MFLSIFTAVFVIEFLFLTNATSQSSSRTRVVVLEASKSVGLEVFKKLQKRKQFEVVGIVGTMNEGRKLRDLGATVEQIKVANVADRGELRVAFQGAQKVIDCRSSSPRRRLVSYVKSFFRKVFRGSSKLKGSDMFYSDDESPYRVDYIGLKNCVDAAVDANCDHFVLLSSMGGYRNAAELNEIGRQADDDERVGNLIKWRRAGERYLMKRLYFTIVHAGMLTDEVGGQSTIVWDTDDRLLSNGLRKISKEDVAEVLVQSLLWKEAIGRSIDVASKVTKGDNQQTVAGGPSKDWLRFWAMPGDCTYPAVE